MLLQEIFAHRDPEPWPLRHLDHPVADRETLRDKVVQQRIGPQRVFDNESRRRYGSTDFLSAGLDKQTALLDLIAYRKNESPELGPGIRFFDLARRMIVDAFYTSPAGIEAVGYKGNQAVSHFEVPTAAIGYALKRSGLG